MKTNVRYWKIQGIDSGKLIFEKEVPIGSMTEEQVQMALKCLASKAGLSFDEIVCANAKKRTKIANSLLQVMKDGPYPAYMCGDNPHFIARVFMNGTPVVFD